MLEITNAEVLGWEHVVRGMRNPMNSWEKSDSWFDIQSFYESDGARDCGVESYYGRNVAGRCSDPWEYDCPYVDTHTYTSTDVFGGDSWIGPNDLDLMKRLAAGGPVHAKYRRMIVVYLDILAPLYWWKEFDTYKVGTVANSCSTMHKIHAKAFTTSDFSTEHLNNDSAQLLEETIDILNVYRDRFLDSKDKGDWWQMIQLLPSSYNQKRTIMLNYEVLHNIYHSRKDHKLDEWHTFCDWIEILPVHEIITDEK